MGYRDPLGFVAELQYKTKEFAKGEKKDLHHDLYEIVRSLEYYIKTLETVKIKDVKSPAEVTGAWVAGHIEDAHKNVEAKYGPNWNIVKMRGMVDNVSGAKTNEELMKKKIDMATSLRGALKK